MRILHVSPAFHPAWAYGGIPRCAYELCRELVLTGNEVSVWTTDALDAERRASDSETLVDSIRIIRFKNLSNALAYGPQLYLPRGLVRHTRIHLSEFEIVHVHGHRHLLEWIVAREAGRRGIPYVITANGTTPPIERHIGVKRILDRLGFARILRRAAGCVAVSKAEVAHYTRYGVPEGRVTVIPNGVRAEEFAVLPARGEFRRGRGLGDGPLVLFLGKITPRKGLDVLIRAMALVRPEIRLVVAGNFMMPEAPVRKTVERLGVSGRIHFAGLLSGREKLAAYVDADVTAYPSVDEIFGLVPLESLLCGTPVVVCDDTGCGEIIAAAGAGLLVPYGDPTALAGALTTLLDDPARRAEMVAAGRDFITERFRWAEIARQTRELYVRVKSEFSIANCRLPT